MASRRMFCTELLQRDCYLRLPHTSRELYVHLNLGADDEGLNPKGYATALLCGADPDRDMANLENIGYIYRFATGLVAIAHWHVHNAIPKSRFTPSKFPERNLLEVNDRKEYVRKQDRPGKKAADFSVTHEVNPKDDCVNQDGLQWIEINPSAEVFEVPKKPAETALAGSVNPVRQPFFQGKDKEEGKENNKSLPSPLQTVCNGVNAAPEEQAAAEEENIFSPAEEFVTWRQFAFRRSLMDLFQRDFADTWQQKLLDLETMKKECAPHAENTRPRELTEDDIAYLLEIIDQQEWRNGQAAAGSLPGISGPY